MTICFDLTDEQERIIRTRGVIANLKTDAQGTISLEWGCISEKDFDPAQHMHGLRKHKLLAYEPLCDCADDEPETDYD